MNAFLQEIYGQRAALRDTPEAIMESGVVRRVSQLRTSLGTGFPPVILTGMGSSDFIASAGALLLSERGIPASFFNAGELLHYPSPVLKDALAVCISQSGESYETISLLPLLGQVVAICNNASSTLGKRADYLFLTKAGREEMTSTKTFVSSWQAMLMLCSALTGDDLDAEALSGLAGEALEISTGDIVDFLGDSPSLTMTARGPAMCAASQAALMWMEAAHLPAISMNGGNFRHGPIEMVDSGKVVFIFTNSHSKTYAQSLRLAGDILSLGGKVVLLTDILPPLESPALRVFAVPCPSEELSPVTTIIPVQLIVNAWAEKHGMCPGSFSHGAKVTTTE